MLDCDGVLNRHRPHPNRYCGLDWQCVEPFNQLLRETDARIVITSAWRYLMLTRQMSIEGFEALLLTHGVECRKKVVGYTRKDTMLCLWDHWYPQPNERGKQVVDWIRCNHFDGRYVCIDDIDLGYTSRSLPFVQTERNVGLTWDLALQAKGWLVG